MKVFTIFLLIQFVALSSFAQPNKIWATYFGDGGNDPFYRTNATSVVFDSTGFIYVAGFVFDSTINLATPNSFKTTLNAGNGPLFFMECLFGKI